MEQNPDKTDSISVESTEAESNSLETNVDKADHTADNEQAKTPEIKPLQESSQKDFTLTNDVTGEVVNSWNVGEEMDLVDVIQTITKDKSGPLADGTIPPYGPHTLTLNKDLVIPKTFLLQHEQILTFQSAKDQKFSLSLGIVTHSTPVNEEIFDASDRVNLTLKNLILDGKNQNRGIHIQANGKLTASGCTFQNFIKPSDIVSGGMAIIATETNSVVLTDCIFENNNANGGPAGAIGIRNVPDCQFTNVTFRNNEGSSAGALMIEKNIKYGNAEVKALINNCIFESNKATKAKGVGGAIYINQADVTINSSTFNKNQAPHGGAIIIFKKSNLAIENSVFKENKATLEYNSGRGGAILSQAPIQIKNSSFLNNSATNQGGAIDHDYAEITIENTEFNGNNAGTMGGAMMLWEDGKADIKAGTAFKNNSSGAFGGAIFDNKLSYENPADAANGYTNLKTDETIIFEENSTPYLYNPPSNYKDFPWVQFARTTFTGKLNPNTQESILKYDFPLNNYDINYVNDLQDEFFPVTFEYKSINSEKSLPESIANSCPSNITAPLNSLIIPALPDPNEIEIDGQRWRFEKWEPGSHEVKKEGIHFIGYWTPLRNIQVNKVWEDDNNQDSKRPESITVKLLADGKDTGKTLVLSEKNNWTDHFIDLAEYDADKEIAYTVAEVELGNDYTVSITGNALQGFVITNSYEPKATTKPTESTSTKPTETVPGKSTETTPTGPTSAQSKKNDSAPKTGDQSLAFSGIGLLLTAAGLFILIKKQKLNSKA